MPPVAAPQIEAFKKSLAKLGLIELVRTGRISLKRGERVFDTGAWMPRCAGWVASGLLRVPKCFRCHGWGMM